MKKYKCKKEDLVRNCKCGETPPQIEGEPAMKSRYMECLNCGRTIGAPDRAEVIHMWNAANALGS